MPYVVLIAKNASRPQLFNRIYKDNCILRGSSVLLLKDEEKRQRYSYNQ